MLKYNILVTGVGAIIGYGIINSLRKCKYDVYIIGMDIYEDAIGQQWCDKFIKAPLAYSAEYLDFLISSMEKYQIDLVMFGTEQEIYKVNSSKNFLGEYYKKLVVNNDMLLQLSKDKWKTYCFLKDNDMEAIPSAINGNYMELANRLGIPFLLKPRSSYASKGIVKIENEIDFNYWKPRAQEQFMVQEIVGDVNHEYTVATFGFGNGSCIKPIVMRRKLSQTGATEKAMIQVMPELESMVIKLTEISKAIGPTNYQFRYHKGNCLLLEVNPRISSSTSIRAAFGYNESEMCIEYFCEGKRPKSPKIKQGEAIRYISDCINYL